MQKRDKLKVELVREMKVEIELAFAPLLNTSA
jgi:hypothetical protein